LKPSHGTDTAIEIGKGKDAMIRDTSERRQRISTLVRERGSVQVAPLAESFGVSMQTIRKDLRFLATRGVMAAGSARKQLT
jgi:DeoR family transcriptional regulator of aga operon